MISPQGYQLGEDPKSKNPFWGDGEDSSVDRIFATATVDDGIGTPGVSVTKTVNGNDITFAFHFDNLKGESGTPGLPGSKGEDGFSPIITFSPLPGEPGGYNMAVITKEGTQNITIANGTNGANGMTPDIDLMATVDNTTGTPTVEVTKSGTAEEPVFVLDFKGIKGESGFSPEIILTPIESGYHMKVIDATGEQEITIANGENGQGVPAGGTAGQVLTKIDGTDYNTEWRDSTGGGGVTKEVLLHKLSPKLSEIQSILDNNINSVVFIACTLGNDAIPLEDNTVCYPSVCYLSSGEKRNITGYNNTITFNTDGTTQNIISSRGDATIELLPGFYLITDNGNGAAGLRFISSGGYYDYIGNSNYGKDLYVENLDKSLYIKFIRETFPYISGGKFKVDYKIPGSGSPSLSRTDILGSEYSSSAYISIVKVM